MAEKNYYSTGEVAEMFGVTRQTVYDWIKRGELEARPTSPIPGSPYRITQAAIDDFNARLLASGGQREDETDPPRRNDR